MKTRSILNLSFLILASSLFIFSSCKKENIQKGKSDSASMEQLSNDENNMEAVTDDALKDVESVLSYQGGGYKSLGSLPCNATLDSASVVNDTVTLFITYNGLSCNGNRSRTGQVEIRKRIGTHWGQAGASIQIRYIDFAVTKVATGRTITLNGVKIFENVSGGFIWQLGLSRSTIIQKVSGNMQITFDNGDTRSWNIARQRTYTGSVGHLSMTVDGFGSSGEYSNLVTWGTNRNGEDFYTSIAQSIVHRESCGWDPVAGVKVHRIPAQDKSATLTFGYNSSGTLVTGDECPTHFRLDWINGTYSGTKYIALP